MAKAGHNILHIDIENFICLSLPFSCSFSLTFILILNYLRCRHEPKDDHSWQRILTPIIWRLLIDYLSPISTPFYKSPPTSTPIAFLVWFLWLNGLLSHFWYFILFNDIMDLKMLNLDTIVSEGHCNKVSSLLRSDTYAFYAGTLILYHIHIQGKIHRS